MNQRTVILAVFLLVMVVASSSCTQRDVLPLKSHLTTKPCDRWRNLLVRDLSNCVYNPDSWLLEDGVLTRKGGGDIWTKKKFGDFILDLEFKVAKGSNSGVMLRTANIEGE